MKAKITIKLDKDLLREERSMAAEQGISISALLAAELEEAVGKRLEYQRAKKRALAVLDRGLNLGWRRPLSRDELHER